MKLDRNLGGDGRGKYGLIKTRRIAEILADNSPDQPLYRKERLEDALHMLKGLGVLDWGDTQATEFFVMRLKDINARPALFAYASGAAMHGDKEYAEDVFALAHRAGKKHPNCKMPD